MAKKKKTRYRKITDSQVLPGTDEVDRTCPLCGKGMIEPVDGVSVKHWQDTIARIIDEHPDWSEEDGACVRCLVYYGMSRAGRAGEET